jgi:hypothetical protein
LSVDVTFKTAAGWFRESVDEEEKNERKSAGIFFFLAKKQD